MCSETWSFWQWMELNLRRYFRIEHEVIRVLSVQWGKFMIKEHFQVGTKAKVWQNVRWLALWTCLFRRTEHFKSDGMSPSDIYLFFQEADCETVHPTCLQTICCGFPLAEAVIWCLTTSWMLFYVQWFELQSKTIWITYNSILYTHS